ncbi:MAG: hypothetical protein RSC34_00930, partial [Alistipes sp.]
METEERLLKLEARVMACESLLRKSTLAVQNISESCWELDQSYYKYLRELAYRTCSDPLRQTILAEIAAHEAMCQHQGVEM